MRLSSFSSFPNLAADDRAVCTSRVMARFEMRRQCVAARLARLPSPSRSSPLAPTLALTRAPAAPRLGPCLVPSRSLALSLSRSPPRARSVGVRAGARAGARESRRALGRCARADPRRLRVARRRAVLRRGRASRPRTHAARTRPAPAHARAERRREVRRDTHALDRPPPWEDLSARAHSTQLDPTPTPDHLRFHTLAPSPPVSCSPLPPLCSSLWLARWRSVPVRATSNGGARARRHAATVARGAATVTRPGMRGGRRELGAVLARAQRARARAWEGRGQGEGRVPRSALLLALLVAGMIRTVTLGYRSLVTKRCFHKTTF
jgi:hypothetical protein